MDRPEVLGGGLYAALVRLRARGAVGPVHGRMAHAAFLEWIARGDPALAAALHDGQGVRPFTVALLPGRAPGGRDLTLRCTLLGDDLFAAFTRRLQEEAPTMALGSGSHDVMEVTTRPDTDGWAGQTTWRALVERTSAAHSIAVEFATPTCFSRGAVAGRQRVELLPLQEWVWESWARKWTRLAPAPVDVRETAELAARWALLADVTLHTRTLDFGRFKQKGFVGRARYELLPDTPESVARLLNRLADFAYYAGTGYKTAMGLGLTRRLPS